MPLCGRGPLRFSTKKNGGSAADGAFPLPTLPRMTGVKMRERTRMAYRGFDLTGKVSLITGGNGGIGFGMADALAEAGADICIWGTNPKKNGDAAEKLKRHGRKVHTQIVDVGDQAQVKAGFAETLKVMGHVDNCVANSGVSGRGKGSLLEMDYEEWRRVMRVNLDGVFFTFQAAA